MKPSEVWIILAVVLAIGWYWYSTHTATTPQNPTNATSPGFLNTITGGIL
jgi:hypothetical protein